MHVYRMATGKAWLSLLRLYLPCFKDGFSLAWYSPSKLDCLASDCGNQLENLMMNAPPGFLLK